MRERYIGLFPIRLKRKLQGTCDYPAGETVTGKTGDLFYFPKGSVITFATDAFGVGYFCGQRGADEA